MANRTITNTLPTRSNRYTIVKECGETKTLVEFIEEITGYAKNETKFKCYRGQQNVKWASIPGLYRPDLVSLYEHEKRAVRDLISVHPNEFAGDDTMFDRLVRMQHFGLPTRLMDVSLNPLVALYFATAQNPKDEPETNGVVSAFSIPASREKYYDSDSVSCIANLANLTRDEKEKIISIRAKRDKSIKGKKAIAICNRENVYKRLIQFIRAEKSYFLPIIKQIDLFKPYYVHAKMSNRRILSQAGGFIIFGLEPLHNIRYGDEIVENRFTIPASAKAGLRRELELLGIDESTLFPEIDRAAKRIEMRYKTKP